MHVPTKSVTQYKNTAPWNTFMEVVALTDNDPKPTGIEKVESNITAIENVCYDQNGRRVMTPTQKGIYIKSGKKYVLK